MKDHYRFLCDGFVKGGDGYLSAIVRDEKNPSYLSFSSEWNGIVEASHFGVTISYAIILFYLPGQKYYHDISLIALSRAALRQYNKHVHDDGTVDYRMTNFHDPAQTGFNVFEFFSCVELIDKYSTGTEEETALLSEMRDYLRRAGDAMANLGFHTPNHRWVISSALATVYNQTHEQKYLDAIGRFISEGIDCDSHGEYTERSAGHYNHVCDQAFIELAHQTGDESFLEYPRRNLNLMMSFAEPDNTINSLNSTRMDKDQIRGYDEYYPFYLYMALAQKNQEFAYIADEMLERFERGVSSPVFTFSHLIRYFLMNPELIDIQNSLVPVKPEGNRSVFLPDSGIARIYGKNGDSTLTLYRGHTPIFMKLQYKTHIIYARFAGAFFGDPHSQFRPSVLEATDDGFRLYSEEHAGYRSQFDTPPETSVWRKMDHSKRRWINIQDYCVEIKVRPEGDDVVLDISAGGCEGIPTKLEFLLDPGFRLESENLRMFTRAGDYILNAGRLRCLFPDLSAFDISGGFCSHYYAQNMRGAVPDDLNRVTVAMTGATPQKNTVRISLVRHI